MPYVMEVSPTDLAATPYLNFKEHEQKTTARANKIVGVMGRTFDFLTEGMFVQLFKIVNH